MRLEEIRYLHEDLERLEAAIADRLLEEPVTVRDRLGRDHEIRGFLDRIGDESKELIKLYEDEDTLTAETQKIGTGETFAAFEQDLAAITQYYDRNRTEPAQNLEKAYKKRSAEEGIAPAFDATKLFSGEEGYGRYFDLTKIHLQYLNLPKIKDMKHVPYLRYLDIFDAFTPPELAFQRGDKMNDAYLGYLIELQTYLQDFMARVKPLENLEAVFAQFDREFEEAWKNNEVPGWEDKVDGEDTEMGGTDNAIWCEACKKDFARKTTYDGHLSGKKHKKAAAALGDGGDGAVNGRAAVKELARLKEKTIAAKEFRIKKLAGAMQTERSDTKVNVERRQALTEREREAELQTLYEEAIGQSRQNQVEEESDDDNDDKIYNPLKLPLAWDGKPIPYWLYKLHGLGVEFPCEICGNFVYMGRRAFDKHFTEPRHVYGLKCLGITATTLFREITNIEEAQRLWNKIQDEKKKEKSAVDNVVQMEDSQGNVMPEKIYHDLARQGLL